MSYQKMKNRLSGESWPMILLAIVFIFAVVGGIYWLVSWLLMWGWNTIMPAIFSLPVINQWMAFAMIIVANIIGSSFKPSSSSNQGK